MQQSSVYRLDACMSVIIGMVVVHAFCGNPICIQCLSMPKARTTNQLCSTNAALGVVVLVVPVVSVELVQSTVVFLLGPGSLLFRGPAVGLGSSKTNS